MTVNFTGINNIKILKAQYERIGAYQTKDQGLELKQGKKLYTEMKLSAKLTDDKAGNDLTDYMTRVPGRFINKNEPDKIELHIKRFDVPEEKEDTNLSLFKLNGKDLIINDNKKLPLMTFLARFTRESAKNPELSKAQQECMQLANKSIAKETMEYIDLQPMLQSS